MTMIDPVSASSPLEEPTPADDRSRLPRHQRAIAQSRSGGRRRRVKALMWRAMLGAAYTAGGAAVSLALKWAVTAM